MAKSPIIRVFAYLKNFPVDIVCNVVFNVMAIFFNLFSFVMIIPFVELLFGTTQPPLAEPQLALDRDVLSAWLMWTLCNAKLKHGIWLCLIVVSLGYLLCSFLSNLFRYLGMFFLSRIRNGMIACLRDDVYNKITILPVSYFNSRRRGDLISRMSNDLADVEWSVVSTMQSLVKDPINIIVFSATLIFISPKLFLYFLMIMPVAVLLIGLIGKTLKRNSETGQTALGSLFAVLEESLSSIRVIKSFVAEDKQSEVFRNKNNRYARTMKKVIVRRELSSPLSEVLGTVGLVAILVLGAAMVVQGDIHASVFIFFVIIFARLIPPVQAVVKAYNSLQKGAASAARFFEVLDADEKIIEKEQAVQLKPFGNSIAFRNVSFSYTVDEGASDPVYVLKDINLTVKKGTSVALVGPSGAGKTTLVDLIPRFYDCTAGSVAIDGVDVRDCKINDLRNMVGVVSQNCILFNDTVANNIAFGRTDCTREQVVEAAKVAFADGFISQLPHGYDTYIGDRGLNLSGGQRQRLSIARAVLKNPPILILDEATSALDADSEHMVQQALTQLLKNRTSIVIAHRLSTIVHSDSIIVLENGLMVGQGTHVELLENNFLYKKLIDMQSFV